MNCKIKPEKLTGYLDGELSKEEMLEMTNHIKSCEECQTTITELEDLSFKTMKYYEDLEASIDLGNMMNDLANRLNELDEVNEEYTKQKNILKFPEKKQNKFNIFEKIYKFAPAAIALAAIILLSFNIFYNKSNSVTTINQASEKTDGVSVESLEYNKFNAMIYKTKEKNKTVIWLFEEENSDDEDGPI